MIDTTGPGGSDDLRRWRWRRDLAENSNRRLDVFHLLDLVAEG